MERLSHLLKWRAADVLSRKYFEDEYSEALALIGKYDEMERSAAPGRPNLTMNALFLLESAIKLMCIGAANPEARSTDLIPNLLQGSLELIEATFTRNAFWSGKPDSPPDHAAERPRWHAEATRVREYSRSLLSNNPLDNEALKAPSREFDFAAETYRAERIWNVSTKPLVFSAIRTALLGGAAQDALRIANQKRALSDFPAQIKIHKQFVVAVADAKGGVIAPTEASAVEDYFNNIRTPIYKEVVDSLGESIYCSKPVALLEWAVLKDRHVHGHPVEKWDRVVGYIVA